MMNQVKKIGRQFSRVMLKDKYRLLKKYRKLKTSKQVSDKQITALLKTIEASKKIRQMRMDNKPSHIIFDPDLPICQKKDEIIDAIQKNRVLIISGETGSGKTTQIPKFCLKAGLGIKGLIGCTQPRRIAAVNVAKRIAHEFGQPAGQAVGYKIRFDDNIRPETYIKLMTDGILLAETQTDPFLNTYDTIIVDEAHERSLNIDFTLGILRQLVKKRKDLKLIITSATIDTEKFSAAFHQAPVIEVSGRMYPVETVYSPLIDKDGGRQNIEDQGYVEAAADNVIRLLQQTRTGDILVFMPAEQDIGETLKIIRAKRLPGISALPLFARLPAKEQAKIFSRQVGRKIIVATNVAETSLTIPGIKYVIDTGLARIPSYSPRTRTTALPISPISQSSANQRMGRCGRIENGICIRLYDKEDFNSRPVFTTPEILRSNLAEVILRMIALNLGDVSAFPFIDAPAPKSIKDGFSTLIELDAIKENVKKGQKKSYILTPIGKIMAKLPVDPKLSRILIEADKRGCLNEAIIITTALAISDPRQRPAEKAQAADQKHMLFKDPSSDFITLLNIWTSVKSAEKKLASRSKLKKYCQDHFLSFKRLREWQDIHRQIARMLKEHGIRGTCKTPVQISTKGLKSKEFSIGGPLYTALHRSLLSGYLANIAHKKEKNIFTAAKGQQAMIFPGSGLFDSAGNWIVAAEFIKTSQLFARTVANIDPDWLEEAGKNLCTHTYSDPHWEKKRGEVIATEQVSLFGLIIVSGRNTAYGKINPEESGEIFIRHALVQGEINQKFRFMTRNRSLINEIADIENKIRKRDILASENDMYTFYQSRLPKPFYNIQTFSKFIKDQKNDNFLIMTQHDIQKSIVDERELSLFPDSLTMAQGRFKLAYNFNPGSAKDGVTIKVPAACARQVSRYDVDRLVPGLFEEKVAALIRALPKHFRIKLSPISDTAKIIAEEMPLKDKPLFSLLSAYIQKRFKLTIPATQWSDRDLPDHLKMRISIRDRKGSEIKALRNTKVLDEFYRTALPPKEDLFNRFEKKFEKSNIITWNFNDLAPHILIKQDDDFIWKAFPGLCVEDNSNSNTPGLSLKLFKSEDQALTSHKKGIEHLYKISYPDNFRALKKDVKSSQKIKQIAHIFGGMAMFAPLVYNLITKTVFSKNIRQKKEFESFGCAQIPLLYDKGQEILTTIFILGKTYQDCFDLISKLLFQHQKKKKTFDELAVLFRDLKNLVPSNFIELYTYERIQQLHRYVTCIKIRAGRTFENISKEEKKMALLNPYKRHLDTLLPSLTQASSNEKSQMVEDYFWLLEEYKISLFAPEIKTAVKISAKRLDKFLTKVSCMI